MANTFVKISTVTVGSGGAATIDFTSIPQTFTDLKIVLSLRESGATTMDSVYFSFNGSGGTAYSTRWLQGDGASATSSNSTGAGATGFIITTGASATASVFSNTEIYIPNYTSSNNKSVSMDSVGENNAATAWQRLIAGLWANTAAITSISFTAGTGSFSQYSTATLYGIKSI